MAAMLSGGRLADVVLFVMVAEGVLLVRGGRGWRATATMMLPGALLVLALRAALDAAPPIQIILPLTLSLPAHLLDLRSRGILRGLRPDPREDASGREELASRPSRLGG